jgi:hypothetical protein
MQQQPVAQVGHSKQILIDAPQANRHRGPDSSLIRRRPEKLRELSSCWLGPASLQGEPCLSGGVVQGQGSMSWAHLLQDQHSLPNHNVPPITILPFEAVDDD